MPPLIQETTTTMFSIQLLDSISTTGLACLNNEQFTLSNELTSPHAILLRSTNIHQYVFPNSLQVLGRAGAGTNNIPVEHLTTQGIPVFNTPGANANAVKELVLTGLLLASRKICQAWDYVRQLPNDDTLNSTIEDNKKRFTGNELPGKTLGVIGLGNIGVSVANAAHHLGMKVLGYDPNISVKNAWKLSSSIQQAEQLPDLLQQADFLTLHVPLTDQTNHLINSKNINQLKANAVILNFSRAQIVDTRVIKNALDNQHISCYVSDFPNEILHNHPDTITLPHLGASTHEAQENCAIMIAEQVKNFLIDGDILHSVNFPQVKLKRSKSNRGHRISITNYNVPNMVAQISSVLSDSGLNILDMINKSRNDLAYNLIDLDQPINAQQLQALQSIEGVLKTRDLQ